MGQLDPEWTLPSRIAGNPLAWMVMVDGMIVDIRRMLRELQEAAFAKGLIPYLPGHGETADSGHVERLPLCQHDWDPAPRRV